MIGSQLKIIYTNHPLHSSILSNKISIYRKYPNFFLYKKKQIVCTIILTNFIHLEHRFPYRDTRRSIRNNRIVIGWLWCLFKFEWTRSANCFAFLYLTAHPSFCVLQASSRSSKTHRIRHRRNETRPPSSSHVLCLLANISSSFAYFHSMPLFLPLSFFKSFRKLLRSPFLSLSFSFTRNFPSRFHISAAPRAFPISARISKIPACMDFSIGQILGRNWLCQEREVVRIVKVQGWVSFFGNYCLNIFLGNNQIWMRYNSSWEFGYKLLNLIWLIIDLASYHQKKKYNKCLEYKFRL